MTRNIVWLASYPKSGNTWLRVFLANYLFRTTQPMPINQIHRLGMGDSIAEAYRKIAGGRYDETDIRGTLALRPRVLKAITANKADVNLVKTHAMRKRVLGTELIPPDLTRAAIYILRDPIDVAVSYARHFGRTHAEAVEQMAGENNIVTGGSGSTPQFLGNWSAHVRGWESAKRFPLLVLRYEDMQADPAAAFTRVLEHLGVPVETERMERAIRFSSFGEMQKQEAAHGFIEKGVRADRFFATGTAGQGRQTLGPALSARIEADHGAVMREHGYL